MLYTAFEGVIQMVRCNLSVLLAERKLKISKVAAETGISRTTLTALAYNYSQGIQFDTLNKLCSYLNVGPNQLVSWVPIDVKVGSIDISEDLENIIIAFEFMYNGKKTLCSISGSLNIEVIEGCVAGFEINLELWDEAVNPPEVKAENDLLRKIFSQIPDTFITDIGNEIFNKLANYRFKDYRFHEEDVGYRIMWPLELRCQRE